MPISVFDVVSGHVNARNVHYDKKSVEATTRQIKPKYKIAGYHSKDLDIFLFFVSTGDTHPDAYSKQLTVIVEPTDWESVDKSTASSLLNENSHLDIRHIESLTSNEVWKKMRDAGNRFSCVARLPESKFRELQQKKAILVRIKARRPVSGKELHRITVALDYKMASDFTRKYGI